MPLNGEPLAVMLRLTAVSTRMKATAAALVALVGIGVGVRVAREHGAFGCAYTDREHVVSLTLAKDSPRARVRIGEGIRITQRASELEKVLTSGKPGLAAGTQNGVRDYVYTVTGTGDGLITGITAGGQRVRGRVSAHC
jgi:hypothetical protein